VPIAAALVAGGLPPGAALVFLMAGPATNVATMGAIFRRFGGWVLAVYLATITIGSGIAAFTFDWLIAETAIETASHTTHDSWWAQACAMVLLGLFVWFLAVGFARRLRRRSGAPAEAVHEVRVAVHGMRCGSCVARLEGVLHKTDGVKTAVVNLQPGEAIVWGSLGESKVREVIREAGFRPE
jgi:copper chaperone CopZ